MRSSVIQDDYPSPHPAATVRRVKARGLQANGAVPVGRVPSRGVCECEICRLARIFYTRGRARHSVRAEGLRRARSDAPYLNTLCPFQSGYEIFGQAA